jgi:hypothetical protein
MCFKSGLLSWLFTSVNSSFPHYTQTNIRNTRNKVRNSSQNLCDRDSGVYKYLFRTSDNSRMAQNKRSDTAGVQFLRFLCYLSAGTRTGMFGEFHNLL